MNSARLKTETQDFHDRIERVMNSELLFSNQFTKEHYQDFILKSYKYIRLIQGVVNTNWIIYEDILIHKLNALNQDIKHLDLEIPSNKNIISNKDNSYSLGLIYIILGAMLGNKIILKKIKEYPSFLNYPFAYLSENQNNFGEIWKEFQNIINNLEEQDLNKVIQGAKDGYMLFSE